MAVGRGGCLAIVDGGRAADPQVAAVHPLLCAANPVGPAECCSKPASTHLPTLITCYADRVRGSNVDLDFLGLIDVRSYKLQCKSNSHVHEFGNVWANNYELSDRDQTAPRAIPIFPPHQNCVVS